VPRRCLAGNRRPIVALLLVAAMAGSISAASGATVSADGDPELIAVAYEARRAVAIINDFYADHHACPQPSIPAELRELEGALGDGFSVEPQGQFAVISALMMPSGPWLYYSSSRYPDRCTLWRKLDGDVVLIWRRHSYGATWSCNPGDGRGERSIKLRP
jgi:hypothetical protein